MTSQEMTNYWRSNERLRIAVERRYTRELRAALKRQSKKVYDVILAQGPDAALLGLDMIVNQEDIRPTIQRMRIDGVKKVLPPYFRHLLRLEAEAERSLKAFFEIPAELLAEVITYLQLTGATRVTQINEYTKEVIRNLLLSAKTEGLTIRETAAKIMSGENYSFAMWRALRIARTELTKVTNAGKLKLNDKSRYELVNIWVSATDERTRGFAKPKIDRPNHWAMRGEQAGEGGVFSNGLKFPGDPDGPAAEVVNCRCSLASDLRRDANGRAIVRPGQPSIRELYNRRLNLINAT